MFNPNSGFLYVIAAIVITFVIAESVFFLVGAWRRAKAFGMDTAVLKKTVGSSAVFTVAPAPAILHPCAGGRAYHIGVARVLYKKDLL